jgi:putative tryptophan/tyrosine transport system substrate-binding protein
MKKYVLPLSLALNTLAFLYIFHFAKTPHEDTSSSFKSEVTKQVVIISPAVHKSLEEIECGVIENIKKEYPNAHVTSMNANGKKTLMLAQVQEALNAKPDAIVTIGAHASQLTHEFIKKRNSPVLHVFTAVTNPESLGLTHNPQALTGVEEKSDYQLTSKILNHIAPHVRSLLLVYNPGEGNALERERQELEAALREQGISLTPVEAFASSEIAHKTKSLIAAHDAVVVLKDNTVVAGIDGLVKLCEQHNKLLIAHDLDSADKGAALSFGVKEKAYGLAAGKIVTQAFTEQSKPLPPIQRLDKNHVKINTANMSQQNLQLNQAEIMLLRSVIII